MLHISGTIHIPDDEIELSAIRAQGPGGQNVNKASCAVQLRFDVAASSLPPACKEKLLALNDQRIAKTGVIVIKAQRHRSLALNRDEALGRLEEMIRMAVATRKKRIATRPTRGSQQRRLEEKCRRGRTKASRGRVFE